MESHLPRNDKASASSSRSRKFITDEEDDHQRAIRRRTEPTSGVSVEGFSPAQSELLSETNNETTFGAASAEGFRPTRLELSETSNETSTMNEERNRRRGGYACKYCSKYFSASQALGGHMNRHRREKEEDRVNCAIKLLSSTQHEFVITDQPLREAHISSFPSSTSTQRPTRCACPVPYLINTNPADQYNIPPAASYYASAEAVGDYNIRPHSSGASSSKGRISSLNWNVHAPPEYIAGSQSHVFHGGTSDMQNTRLNPLADQPTVVTADTHVDTSSLSPLQRGRLTCNYTDLPSSSSTGLTPQQYLYYQRNRGIFDSNINSMQQLQHITPDKRTPNIVVQESNYNDLVNRYYSNLLEELGETSSTPNIEAVQRRPQIEEASRVTTSCTDAGIFTSSSMRLTPSSFNKQTNIIDSVDHLPLSSTQQREDTPFLSQTAARNADYVNYDTKGMMNFPSVASSEAPFHQIMEATTAQTSDPILQYLRDSPTIEFDLNILSFQQQLESSSLFNDPMQYNIEEAIREAVKEEQQHP